MASITVVDDHCIGCDVADHVACMDHGLCFQFDPAFRLFVVWEVILLAKLIL